MKDKSCVPKLLKFGVLPVAMFFMFLFAFAGYFYGMQAQALMAADVAKPGNLIANSSLETPDKGWFTKKSAVSTVKFSNEGGYNGTRAARIDVTQATEPAYWYFQPVTIQPGSYQFLNFYKATVATKLIAEYTLDNGSVMTTVLAQPAPSAKWKSNLIRFNAPTGAVKMTVYQAISQSGMLITDAYSLKRINASNPLDSTRVAYWRSTCCAPRPSGGEQGSNQSQPNQNANNQDPGSNAVITDPDQDQNQGNGSNQDTNNGTDNNSNTNNNSNSNTDQSTNTNTDTDNGNSSNDNNGSNTDTGNGSGSGQNQDPGQDTLPNLIINSDFSNISAADVSMPANWSKGTWGVNVPVFTYPVQGREGGKAVRVDIARYNDGDAKWYFDDVAIKGGYQYTFSDYYQASSPNKITVRYLMQDNTYVYVDLAVLGEAVEWTRYSGTFIAPAAAKSVTVFHLLNNNGWLTIGNCSLVENGSQSTSSQDTDGLAQGMVSIDFDDGWLSAYQNAIPVLNDAGIKTTNYIFTEALGQEGYITLDQVKSLITAGNEVGSHTKSHPYLSTLTTEQVLEELSGSKRWFQSNGIVTNTFAYPYGDYNAGIRNTVVSAGYSGARSSNPGYNDNNTDRYILQIQSVESTTTIEQIKIWIDEAVSQKKWLILLFHEVNDSGQQYSAKPEIITQMRDYIISENIKTVTTSEGLQIISQ